MEVVNVIKDLFAEYGVILELALGVVLIFLVRSKDGKESKAAAKAAKAANKKLKKELLAAFREDLDVFVSDIPDEQLTPEQSARCAAVLAFRSKHKEVKPDEVQNSQ